MRWVSRARWLALRSCRVVLPASSWLRSSDTASSAASSLSSMARCSLPSGTFLSLPLLSSSRMVCVRVWLALISACARSGRVCASISALVARASWACQSLSWVRRSASMRSSWAVGRLA
ncbi:hypothetical protein D3C78_1091680 [compost metagenome]